MSVVDETQAVIKVYADWFEDNGLPASVAALGSVALRLAAAIDDDDTANYALAQVVVQYRATLKDLDAEMGMWWGDKDPSPGVLVEMAEHDMRGQQR